MCESDFGMWSVAPQVYSSRPVRRSYFCTAESTKTPELTPPNRERFVVTFLFAVTHATWPWITIECSVITQPSLPFSLATGR